MKRCPSCGRSLPAQAVRFCISCGQKLAGQDDQPPASGQARHGPPGSQPQRAAAAAPPRRRGWVIALAAVVLVGGAASGAFVLVNTDHGRTVSARAPSSGGPTRTGDAGGISPTPTGGSPTPGGEQAELRRIAALVRSSASARKAVGDATQNVGACTMAPSDGISMMNQAISQRRAVLDGLDVLAADAIPGGPRLLADLKDATQQSIAADQDFIGWMRDIRQAGACPVDTGQDNSYQAGMRASERATRAKQDFAALWNPLAGQFGEQNFSASEI